MIYRPSDADLQARADKLFGASALSSFCLHTYRYQCVYHDPNGRDVHYERCCMCSKAFVGRLA